MAHSITNIGPNEEKDDEEVTGLVSSDDDDDSVVEKPKTSKSITTEDGSDFDTSDDREGK